MIFDCKKKINLHINSKNFHYLLIKIETILTNDFQLKFRLIFFKIYEILLFINHYLNWFPN